MSTLWPWLAVAGAGALHGLNPCTGWMFAAAWSLRSRNRMLALRALTPIAAGHAASVALLAVAVALGVEMGHLTWKVAAGVLLTALTALASFAAYRLSRHCKPCRMPATHAGLALWSCLMSSLHGAGLMLVPALVPLCLSNSPAREITASGSLLAALAAVVVHMAAMLAVTAVMAVLASSAATHRPRHVLAELAAPIISRYRWVLRIRVPK